MLKSRDRRYLKNTLLNANGNVCAICGQEIDLSVQYPDRMSVTIDHRVPVSLGGSDLLNNLQIAHRGCNNNKMASMEEFKELGAKYHAFYGRNRTSFIVDIEKEEVVATYKDYVEALITCSYLNLGA